MLLFVDKIANRNNFILKCTNVQKNLVGNAPQVKAFLFYPLVILSISISLEYG